MSWVYVEGNLLFRFGSDWAPVCAWDRSNAYVKNMGSHDKKKAVDLVGILGGELLMLMEVRDYRVNARKKDEDPVTEFELKVRNTVAGLVGAYRAECYGDCDPFCRALLARSPLRLVYWIEEMSADDPGRRRHKVSAGVDTLALRKKVKWIHASGVVTCNLSNYRDVLPGVEVESLPPERRTRAEQVVELLNKRFPEKKGMWDELEQRVYDCLDRRELDAWLERAKIVRSPWDILRPTR